MKMHVKPGYILLITFMMLSFALANVILLFTFQHHHTGMIRTLTVKCLTLDCALSAPDILKGLLTEQPGKEKEQKEEKKEEKKALSVESMKNIALLWKYTQFLTPIAFAEEKENSIRYAIMLGTEEGKINLNGLYNFSNASWLSPQKKDFCKWLFQAIAKHTKTDSLFEQFEAYLKKRGHYFNDVSELFEIKEFSKVFSSHLMRKSLEKDNSLYLGELFTVCTEQDTINCVGLSSSFALLVGAKKENMIELLQQKEKMQEIFKLSSVGAQGLATFFEKVYGIDLNSMPQEFKSLLTMNFELNIFSIVLTAFAQKMASTAFAIIKRQTSGTSVTYDVMKVYQV